MLSNRSNGDTRDGYIYTAYGIPYKEKKPIGSESIIKLFRGL